METFSSELKRKWRQEFREEMGLELFGLEESPSVYPRLTFDTSFQGGEGSRLPRLSGAIVGEVTLHVWIATDPAGYRTKWSRDPLDLLTSHIVPFFARRYGLRPESFQVHKTDKSQEILTGHFEFTLFTPFLLPLDAVFLTTDARK